MRMNTDGSEEKFVLLRQSDRRPGRYEVRPDDDHPLHPRRPRTQNHRVAVSVEVGKLEMGVNVKHSL